MPKRNLGKSFEQIKAAIIQVMKEAPTIAGVEGVNHFKKSFRDEGFTDETLEKWKPRKKTDEGRNILTKTGRLRRGIKILRKDATSVVVGVDLSEVPYAQVHNDGYNGTQSIKAAVRKNKRNDVYDTKTRRRSARGIQGVSAHTRTMKIPKRQFIGSSRQLDRKIEKQIASRINKILNG